jgi:predicted aconitase with swiveling domain
LRSFSVRIIIDGNCYAEVLIINRNISFFGEVDPVRGVIKPENKSLKGKALIFRGGRGSTVGSYIIYALKYYGNKPECMIVSRVEPIIITGCILADIPLFIVDDYDEFINYIHNHNKRFIRHDKGSGIIVVE